METNDEPTPYSLCVTEILWILTNNDGKMGQSRLRAHTGMRYALLNPILEELAREGRIRIATGKDSDLISLISR